MIEECNRQTAQVEAYLEQYDAEALKWRPDERGWSATGQIAHLVLVNGPYLKRMAETIAAQRAGSTSGPTSGPWKHPWFSRWFAKSMEPPVKRRYKTMKSMVPDIGAEPASEVEAFRESQATLRTVLEDARGLDMGRVRFASPFFSLFRFSLGGGLALLLAHNRRHIWQIEQLLAHPGFPGRR